MANQPSALLLTIALFAAPAIAQQGGSPAYTLKASANLVILDVVVLGADSRPVRGLKAEDFAVREDGKLQTLRAFQEHSLTATATSAAPPPRLAPGLFTNYAAAPANAQAGPSNVLLLDMLNTPPRDQSYARQQISDYLKHAPLGQIAIFGLSNGLTNPAGLHRKIPQSCRPPSQGRVASKARRC